MPLMKIKKGDDIMFNILIKAVVVPLATMATIGIVGTMIKKRKENKKK